MQTFPCADIDGGLRHSTFRALVLWIRLMHVLVPGAEGSLSVAGGCTVPHGRSERTLHGRVAHCGCVRKGTSLWLGALAGVETWLW